MGKGHKKGKKSKHDFDSIFESKPAGGSEWQTGPISMALDDDDGDLQPAAAKPTAAADGDFFSAMDIGDKPKGPKPSGLGVKVGTLKRGIRTTAQKKRKLDGIEKALARADKQQAKVSKKDNKKAKRLSLRGIY